MSFRDNAAEHRYEFEEDGFVSFADYRDHGEVRSILHVETPPETRGKGHASKLMHAVVEDAKARAIRLRASCAFAVAYFKRHAAEVAPVQA
ncbi:MAG: N-acetyltransferase [Proteobacteria bacterium]|nr:N-acetyltransferase [Pseudomonadota bacterium]